MKSEKTLRELISNLKGRISKVLTWTKELQGKEVFYLSEVFNTLDNIILYDKKLSEDKVTFFKDNLKDYSMMIKNSDKSYIKKHIIPMINSIVEKEWIEK